VSLGLILDNGPLVNFEHKCRTYHGQASSEEDWTSCFKRENVWLEEKGTQLVQPLNHDTQGLTYVEKSFVSGREHIICEVFHPTDNMLGMTGRGFVLKTVWMAH